MTQLYAVLIQYYLEYLRGLRVIVGGKWQPESIQAQFYDILKIVFLARPSSIFKHQFRTKFEQKSMENCNL